MGRVRAFSRPLRGILATLTAAALAASAAGCAGASGASSDDITIAYQPGIGYAPLLVVKEQRTLEKKFPDKKITWRVLNSGAAIRDGMVSRDIQIGAGGIGPFIVGASNGIPWKIFVALDNANLQLMSKQAKSLAEIKGAGKIAMPGPDSIQSVVLRKAAKEQLGDAKVLDSQIVAMGHPDGLQALVSGQIAGHLTAPPFQSQAAKEGARPIVSSYDVFGEHTFNSVFTTVDFHEGNADFVKGLQDAVADAVKLLEQNPDQAAELLSRESGGKVSAAELKEQITGDDITYSTKPLGFMKFAQFMKEIGLIKKTPDKPSEYFFDNQYTKGGN